jgi:AAA15 family ATPase/GTPase
MVRGTLKIQVENFGPVRHGNFLLKPLTVFVGPNNSGKSYLATLAYTLQKTLSRGTFFSIDPLRKVNELEPDSEYFDKPVSPDFKRLYVMLRRLLFSKKYEIRFSELPLKQRKFLQESFEAAFSSLTPIIDRGLRDYFSSETHGDLIRVGSDPKIASLRIELEQTKASLLNVQLVDAAAQSRVKWSLEPYLENFVITTKEIFRRPDFVRRAIRFNGNSVAVLIRRCGTSLVSLL